MKKIIKNGKIVYHDKTLEGFDILIEDGLIMAIKENINISDAEIIDAENMYILPGAVDMFTRIGINGKNTFSANAFKQNSLSALFGGTTTIIESISQVDEESDANSDKILDFVIKEIDGNSYIDYSFHRPYKEEINTSNILDKISHGFPSFAVSLSSEDGISDKELINLLRMCSPYGGITFVDAESYAPISLMEDLHRIKKRNMPLAFASSRPNWTESEAVLHLSNLSRAGGVSLAMKSISTKESVQILQSQGREGFPITILTSPHYLILTEDMYLSNKENEEQTYKYCVHPPLRKKDDIDALWKAINNGLIHCIVSEHVGIDLSHKLKMKDDIFKIPVGIPSVELRLSLLHTFGVLQNKITINKLVEITATHVTRIAGLRSKGRIEAGTDADIVIFDPNKKMTITKKNLHDSSDYSPYEDLELQGFAKHVFLRGKHLIKDFESTTDDKNGELVMRKAVAMR